MDPLGEACGPLLGGGRVLGARLAGTREGQEAQQPEACAWLEVTGPATGTERKEILHTPTPGPDSGLHCVEGT